MLSVRDCLRRLSPRDPLDRPKYILIAVCAAVAIASLVLLLMHPR